MSERRAPRAVAERAECASCCSLWELTAALLATANSESLAPNPFTAASPQAVSSASTSALSDPLP